MSLKMHVLTMIALYVSAGLGFIGGLIVADAIGSVRDTLKLFKRGTQGEP